MESSILPTASIVMAIAACVYYVLRRRSTSSRHFSWPKVKQHCAYTQKVAVIKKKDQLVANSLDDFTPVGNRVPVHDVTAFFASCGNEFSPYSIDWEQEAVVLIRPIDGTDLKLQPFFREAQRLNADEVLLLPFDLLQAVVDSIAGKTAHVQEIFVYMTARCGSTLLTRAVEATSVAQAVNEPEVLDVISLQIIRARRSRQCENQTHNSHGGIPAVVQNDETSVALLRNIVSLLNYHVLTSDHRHRSIIFYKVMGRSVVVADLMYQAFPTAKTVFLYRNGLDFLESWTRLWCKHRIIYTTLRFFRHLGLWRWTPTVQHDFRIFGDDPMFSAVRYRGSYYHHTVARWAVAVHKAIELPKMYPGYFFHAVVYYTALLRGRKETIDLLMKKLGIERNLEDWEEEENRIQGAFAKDSQAGTYLSHRKRTQGGKWTPNNSPPWIGEWEREYMSHVCGLTGNEILKPDVILPDTIH